MDAGMTALPERIARRRRRAATIAGAIVFLLLAVGALVLLGLRSGPQPLTSVLRATQEIRPGSRIVAADLSVTAVYMQDPSVLSTLAKAKDRGALVGQVALTDVPAGALVPANVAEPQATAAIWKAAVPVRRMPADLRAGDHVALLVEENQNGQDVDFVVMQDVVVLDVGSGTVDLWLPAKVAPQIEWYAGHGSLVLLTMRPGAVQSQLPVGGSS